MANELALKPCPFCGGPVKLEQTKEARARKNDEWWGVVCRNAANVGGTCAIEQIPSRTKEAAVSRWNTRTAEPAADVVAWMTFDERNIPRTVRFRKELLPKHYVEAGWTQIPLYATLQAQPAEPSAEGQALEAIRAAMRRYLPPDSGITAEDFASEVIGIVDGRGK